MTDVDELKRHPSVLRLYTDKIRLHRNGKELEGLCPFHPDKNPSFKLRQAEDSTYIWNCFGCDQKGGNVFQFLQKLEGITFNKAVDRVREYVGGTWIASKEKVEETFKSIGAAKKEYKTFSLDEFARLESALPNAEPWLKSRGIDVQTAKRLHVGYRQDLGKLAHDGNEDIADKGWVAFPCIEDGKVVMVEYRSIVRKAFIRQPGMKTSLFNLSAIDMLEPVYLVEGRPDCLVLEAAGYRAVSLPNAGYKLTPEDKDKLLEADAVFLAGDTDKAGSEAMETLWKEMKERTFLVKWSTKDANEMWDKCGRNLSTFRTKVNELTQLAKSTPMPGIYSLQEMMVSRAEDNIADHPNRFRFPWANVDAMAILAPGAVIGFTATNTGMGKTTFIIQATLESARKHGEVVLNYQAELSQEQIARMVASQVLFKHRLELSKADYNQAAELIGSAKYYIGRNPTLTTITPVLDLIEAGVRRLSPTVVVLDNLHFLCRFEPDQVKAMENAMQRIKNMAATYNLKFFVLGAPKKADSTNKGKSLHISDVRGSASFGDDSDAVFTLHRDIIKDRETNKKDEYEPATKIRLVKVRDKGPGDAEVDLVFIGERATFSEVTYQQEPNGQMSYEYAK